MSASAEPVHELTAGSRSRGLWLNFRQPDRGAWEMLKELSAYVRLSDPQVRLFNYGYPKSGDHELNDQGR